MSLCFPSVCVVCGKVVKRGRVTCDDKCRDILFRDRYGKVVGSVDSAGRRLGMLDGVAASFVYREEEEDTDDKLGKCAARNAVLDMKFHGKPWLARELAMFMSSDFKTSGFPVPDLVTGVPSFEKNEGGNAALLARTMCDNLGFPYDGRFLVKIRKTAKQHGISRRERDTNLTDAFFGGNTGSLTGKTVLLVDDVLTSGNTLNECAAACRRAGALKIYAVVFSVRISKIIPYSG